MKISRSQNKQDQQINLTPLIDVVFLLVIFFMVSTSFTNETRIGIELPESTDQPAAESVIAIELVITSQGAYRVNGESLVRSDAQTLQKVLQQQAQGMNLTATPLVISADKDAKHQYVITAMDVAGRMGFTSINLLTQDQ